MFFFRWKSSDLSLLFFGIFCFLYGARTKAFQILFGGAPLFWDYSQRKKNMIYAGAGQFADALIRELFNWSGKPSEEALDDDLTLIVTDYQHV